MPDARSQDFRHRSRFARRTAVSLGRPLPMIYHAYQTHADLMEPVRALARMTADALNPSANGFQVGRMTRHWAAACELLSRAALSHHRPEFGIDSRDQR